MFWIIVFAVTVECARQVGLLWLGVAFSGAATLLARPWRPAS